MYISKVMSFTLTRLSSNILNTSRIRISLFSPVYCLLGPMSIYLILIAESRWSLWLLLSKILCLISTNGNSLLLPWSTFSLLSMEEGEVGYGQKKTYHGNSLLKLLWMRLWLPTFDKSHQNLEMANKMAFNHYVGSDWFYWNFVGMLVHPYSMLCLINIEKGWLR